jgi:hypothetical protein
MGQDIWVGLLTGWTARVRFPAVQIFSLLHSVQTDSGAHRASYTMGTGGSFAGGGGVKRPGRETDHSPPSNVEAENGGPIPPLKDDKACSSKEFIRQDFVMLIAVSHRRNVIIGVLRSRTTRKWLEGVNWQILSPETNHRNAWKVFFFAISFEILLCNEVQPELFKNTKIFYKMQNATRNDCATLHSFISVFVRMGFQMSEFAFGCQAKPRVRISLQSSYERNFVRQIFVQQEVSIR